MEGSCLHILGLMGAVRQIIWDTVISDTIHHDTMTMTDLWLEGSYSRINPYTASEHFVECVDLTPKGI